MKIETYLLKPCLGRYCGMHLLLFALLGCLNSCAEPESPIRRPTSQATLPASEQTAESNRINEQVAAIAAGPHDELPPAQPIRVDPSAQNAEMDVKNNTSYILTVLYSGPTSRSVVLPPHGTRTVELGVGSYMVAATVSASNVKPFAGPDTLQGGEYENTFYIEAVRE